MADNTTLHENSSMDITHSAPSLGSVEVVSEDQSSTTTDARCSCTDDLNELQLLGDDEVGENGTKDDITSNPINQILVMIRDKSFKMAAYVKITLNGHPFLPKQALRQNLNMYISGNFLMILKRTKNI